MPEDRLSQILRFVEERGFASVTELSQQLQVSEMTIRRDLAKLDRQKRLQRTFGGAAALGSVGDAQPPGAPDGPLVDRVDVLVATALNPRYESILLGGSGSRRSIPIIAESLSVRREETVVAVDNFQAGLELGRWAGEYAREHWGGRAHVLDLTYYLENTQTRSRGFFEGVRRDLPAAQLVLSLDAQSRFDTAYQLTQDALTVHQDINLIFAINDITALGAIQACKDLQVDPERLLVLPFGLEGDTLKNILFQGMFCRAGLAMFPEIVGPVCAEAAISAFNHRRLPPQLVTPFMVVTAANLLHLYEQTSAGWQLRWEAAFEEMIIPLDIRPGRSHEGMKMPRRIGLIVPFSEHEWYRNLATSMRNYTSLHGVGFEIVDVHQSLKDEIEMRRREIARLAAGLIAPGDVILIDGGPIANYLAEALLECKGLTILTNAIPVFDILRASAENILILTGGAYRHSSQVLVGPTAEGALRELRVDKLFLSVSGISLEFGLSHTNISEVTIKQAMIRSSREVILLADHTFFGEESVIQVAPTTVIHKLITDDALPASVRLELSQLGIQIMLASV
jgi:DeoR family transcriptional regulator, fructose operon transcriptional repressor